jgi:hypothetical protein
MAQDHITNSAGGTMAEIQTSTWSETPANNNAATPDGWPEGQPPSTVNDCARTMMAAIKRDWNRTHPTVTSGGTTSALTVTYANAPTLADGLQLTFRLGTDIAAGATLAVNGLTARAINWRGAAVVASQFLTGDIVTVYYNASGTPVWEIASPPRALGITTINGKTGSTVTLVAADIPTVAPLASPGLTGTPTAPTAAAGTANTQIANTAFVAGALAAVGGRNRIVNGDFRVAQLAGTSTINSATRVFPIDRWGASGVASAGVFTVARGSGGAAYAYVMTAQVTTAAASPSAAHTYIISQRIEGCNVPDLAWGTGAAQPVTLSFIARSSLTGTFSGAIRNSAQNRSYPFTFAIGTANTDTLITVTIPGDTSGTWLTGAGTIGLEVVFCLGSGSSGVGTAATWAAAGYVGASGSLNVMATLSATLTITNVELDRGAVAPAFEFRPYPVEFALCQRHFQVFGEGQSATLVCHGMSETTASGLYFLPLQVPMAGTPTMTWSAASDFTVFNPGAAGQLVSGMSVTYADSRVVVLTATTSSGLTQGYAGRLISLTTAARIYARAEL